MKNNITFLAFTIILGGQMIKAQKINRAYIDSFVHACDTTFKGSENPLYVIDNFPYNADTMDRSGHVSLPSALDYKVRGWTVDSILSIIYLKDVFSNSIWGTQAGNGIIIINSRNAQTKKMKRQELEKSWTAFREHSDGDIPPVLLVDDSVVPINRAYTVMFKMNMRRISNIDFCPGEFLAAKCLAPGRLTTNGVIRVWLKK